MSPLRDEIARRRTFAIIPASIGPRVAGRDNQGL